MRNTSARYGILSRALHWLIALCIAALVVGGWYTVRLGYMAPAYRDLLLWHETIGLIVFVLGVCLLVWHRISRRPAPVASIGRFERVASRMMHIVLYACVLVLPVTGYIAATEDGPLSLWNLTLPVIAGDPTVALELHWYVAYALGGLALLHAGAALKHHLVDRDATLVRMLLGKERR